MDLAALKLIPVWHRMRLGAPFTKPKPVNDWLGDVVCKLFYDY